MATKKLLTKDNKAHLISIANTFGAVFLTSVATNIDSLDFTNLSNGALIAFGIAILRDVIKRISQKYV